MSTCKSLLYVHVNICIVKDMFKQNFKIRYQASSSGKAGHFLVRGLTRVSGKVHLGSTGCEKRATLVAARVFRPFLFSIVFQNF